MAKNRQLMERWRKWQAKKRRTKPKAFANRAYGIVDRGAMKENGVNAYGHRARSFKGDFDFLAFLFHFPNNPTIRPSQDPRLAVEYKIEHLKETNPLARVLEFNSVFVEGDIASERRTWFFFQGKEFFFVNKDVSVWKRSIIYSDHDYALRLWAQGRIKWLPPLIIPSQPSLDGD